MTQPSATNPAVSTAPAGEPLLNSDLIRERFGSYHVDVLRRNADTRVSVLSSDEQGTRVCRTFAVTQFIPRDVPVNAEVLDHIEDGGSIGATLRRAGFEVDKQSLEIREVRLDDPSHPALERMRLESPVTLAMHVYSLGIRDAAVSSPFAIIAELHHPDFLTSEALLELFSVSGQSPGGGADLDKLRAEIFHIGT